MEQSKEIKVTVLLEHHEGEEYWSASVPLINGCFADGRTPEEATKAVTSEIRDWIRSNPDLLNVLEKQPRFLITEVTLSHV